MATYKTEKSVTFMGMGDQITCIHFAKTNELVAYINEKAQILFVKPVNCNIAHEVIEYAIKLQEVQ
jgi:hypothetical protein